MKHENGLGHMQSIHIEKHSYNGFCVGVGVEYPGIIVSATTDKELIRLFMKAIPSYERGLREYGIQQAPPRKVEVIDISRTDKG